VWDTDTRVVRGPTISYHPRAMLYALLYAYTRRVLRLSGISSDAEAEVLVLRHQLAVLRRQVNAPGRVAATSCSSRR
jgi:hypothetical protein